MTTPQTAVTHNIVELNDVFRPSKSLGQEAWSRLIRNKASVIGMFIIGVYPTIVLNYFNGSSVELLQFIQGLM